jgi:hypothetical protein
MSMNVNLSAITSVFELADLDPYERVTLIYLRTLSAEHGAVFPSYETIALKCGMVRRTAINVIKRLVDAGLITKEHRYRIVAAERKQTSNSFNCVEPSPVSSNSPVEADKPALSNSPYNSNSINTKQEEESINIPAQEIADIPYFPFENEIKRNKITSEVRNAILAHMTAAGADIWHYSAEAIRRAFKKAILRIQLGSGLYNPAKWIASTIRNEQMSLDIEMA